jgi:hypothetical protein
MECTNQMIFAYPNRQGKKEHANVRMCIDVRYIYAYTDRKKGPDFRDRSKDVAFAEATFYLCEFT